METASVTGAFFGGIIFTIAVLFIYYKWTESQQRKKDRAVQATRRAGPYPDHNPNQHDEP